MDHPSAFIVRAAPVSLRGLDVLGQGFRARIVLHGSPPHAGAGHLQAKPRITRLAEPAEILRTVVRFVAVAVVNHQEPNRTAKLASAWAGGNASPGAETVCPVADGVSGLAPAVAASRAYHSPWSSSSSSSSSGAAISRI
jgi:hypothetical protein